MKIFKSKGGYFYKEYKNGKKKRISRIEYDKLRKKSNKKQKGGDRCFHDNIHLYDEKYNGYETSYVYKCMNPYCEKIFPSTYSDLETFKSKLLNEKEIILEAILKKEEEEKEAILKKEEEEKKEKEKLQLIDINLLKNTNSNLPGYSNIPRYSNLPIIGVQTRFLPANPNIFNETKMIEMVFIQKFYCNFKQKEFNLISSICFDIIDLSIDSDNISLLFDKPIVINGTECFLNNRYEQQMINLIKYKLNIMIQLTKLFQDLEIYDEIMKQTSTNPTILVSSSIDELEDFYKKDYVNIERKPLYYCDIPYKKNLMQYNNEKFLYMGWIDVYISRYSMGVLYERSGKSNKKTPFNIYIFRKLTTKNYQVFKSNKRNSRKYGDLSQVIRNNKLGYRTNYITQQRQFVPRLNVNGKEIPNAFVFTNKNDIECIGCLRIRES